MDSYLKNINVLFYGVFSLVKLFLCLLYIVVVYLFWYSGEGLGYIRGLRLVVMIIVYINLMI
jgi:predicted Co/Zn/Cd cation transporter (cation efflux family)